MTPQKINDLRDRMIVALDVPTIWDAYSSARARRSFWT
jgi:hypothetical protein